MYNKTLVVLLSGKAGTGKTHCSDLLYKNFKNMGLNIYKGYFALGLKEVARKYIGWDGNKDERGRKLLQMLGTEVGRAYNPDCWIEYLVSTLENTSGYPYDIILIDDWRFPNEKEYFENNPYYNVYTINVRPSKTAIDKVKNCREHVSEHSLPEEEGYYSVVYYNNFTEDSLKDMKEMSEYIDSNQSKYGESA